MENLCNFIFGSLDVFVMLPYDDKLTLQNIYSDNYQVGG